MLQKCSFQRCQINLNIYMLHAQVLILSVVYVMCGVRCALQNVFQKTLNIIN